MRTLEYKIKLNESDAKIKTKALPKGALAIEGMASTQDIDRAKDIVLPNAFEASLPQFLTNGAMLLNHDQHQPVGIWTEAKITPEGLHVKGFISASEKDLQTKIKEGVYSTLSIGFNPIEEQFSAQLDANVIKKLELLEVSVVTIPCNPHATFSTSSKAVSTENNYKSVALACHAMRKHSGSTYNINNILEVAATKYELDLPTLQETLITIHKEGFEMKEFKELLQDLYSEVKTKSIETSEAVTETATEVKSNENNSEEVIGLLKSVLSSIESKLDQILKHYEASEIKEEEVEEVKEIEVESEEVKAEPKREDESDMSEEEEEDEKESEEKSVEVESTKEVEIEESKAEENNEQPSEETKEEAPKQDPELISLQEEVENLELENEILELEKELK